MRRRRSRRRSTRIPLPTLVLFVCGISAIAVVLGAGGTATASFTTADASRNSGIDVTSDNTGAHTLDVASSVRINSTDPLVEVTNRLGRDVTVTVGLRSDSEHIGDLVVDGTVVGNNTSFTLAEGTTQRVEIEIPDDSSLTGETVYFHVNASAPGLNVTAPDRSVSVNE